MREKETPSANYRGKSQLSQGSTEGIGSQQGEGANDTIFANADIGEFVPYPKVSKEHFDKLFKINVASWVVD